MYLEIAAIEIIAEQESAFEAAVAERRRFSCGPRAVVACSCSALSNSPHTIGLSSGGKRWTTIWCIFANRMIFKPGAVSWESILRLRRQSNTRAKFSKRSRPRTRQDAAGEWPARIAGK